MPSELFIALLHRLQRYDDTMVLYALLQNRADVKEFKTSATQIALYMLGGRVARKQVQRAIDRLVDAGLMETKVYKNYRTYVTIDGGAVDALLATPVSERIPGLTDESFPFLEAWAKARVNHAKHATDEAIERMRRQHGASGDDDKPEA